MHFLKETRSLIDLLYLLWECVERSSYTAVHNKQSSFQIRAFRFCGYWLSSGILNYKDNSERIRKIEQSQAMGTWPTSISSMRAFFQIISQRLSLPFLLFHQMLSSTIQNIATSYEPRHFQSMYIGIWLQQCLEFPLMATLQLQPPAKIKAEKVGFTSSRLEIRVGF